MGFFENVGKKISDVSGKAVEKTKQYTDISTTSYKIRDVEGQINKLYTKLGEAYFNKFADEPDVELKGDVDAIKELKQKIDELNDHLYDVKAAKDGRKRCEHCGELIPADAKFCTKCGQEVKEVADPEAEGEEGEAAQIAESTDVKECPECHAIIKDNADVCPACGAKLDE